MEFFETKVPPPLVAILFAIAMWFVKESEPLTSLGGTLHYVISCGLPLAGILIALGGNLAFRKADTTVNPMSPEKASRLVDSGIYRVTRNPMYLGLAVILTGWAVYLSSAWSFIGIPVFIAYITRFQIIPEERALTLLFGSTYENYKCRVRRWI